MHNLTDFVLQIFKLGLVTRKGKKKKGIVRAKTMERWENERGKEVDSKRKKMGNGEKKSKWEKERRKRKKNQEQEGKIK